MNSLQKNTLKNNNNDRIFNTYGSNAGLNNVSNAFRRRIINLKTLKKTIKASKINNIKGEEVTIIGPNYYRKYIVFGNINIHIFGETHLPIYHMEIPDNAILFSDFFQSLVVNNKDRFYDLFLEKKMRIKDTHSETNISLGGSAMFDLLNINFKSCLEFSKSKCKYKNLRAHYVDLRDVDEVMQKKLSFINNILIHGGVSSGNFDSDENYLLIINFVLDIVMDFKEFFSNAESLIYKKIIKQFYNLEPNLAALLQQFLLDEQTLLNNQIIEIFSKGNYTSIDVLINDIFYKTYDYIDEDTGEIIARKDINYILSLFAPNIAIKLDLLCNIAMELFALFYMDIYMLARMFRIGYVSKNNRYSGHGNNIFTYTGQAHSVRINKFIENYLNVKPSNSIGSNEIKILSQDNLAIFKPFVNLNLYKL